MSDEPKIKTSPLGESKSLSNIGKSIGNLFSSATRSMKNPFIMGVGAGAGYATGKGLFGLIKRLFPENAYGWFLFTSLLLQLNDWFLFHFNYADPRLLQLHLLFALIWAILLSSADRDSSVMFIYRLVINIILFLLIFWIEFYGSYYIDHIFSMFGFAGWNRALFPIWLIFAFFYCMIPQQRTRYVNVVIVLFVLGIFFIFYGQIKGSLPVNPQLTVGKIENQDFVYHLFNQSYNGFLKFWNDTTSAFNCIIDPESCATQVNPNDVEPANIDLSTYGVLFGTDVQFKPTEFSKFSKNLSVIGSLTSGDTDVDCALGADCNSYTSSLNCIIWNRKGSLDSNYDIKGDFKFTGPYKSIYSAKYFGCKFTPKSTDIPEIIQKNPTVNYGAALLFDYETIADTNLFFMTASKYSVLKDRAMSVFDRNAKLYTQDSAGPIVISFGFPIKNKPPVRLFTKDEYNQKLFIIKFTYNTQTQFDEYNSRGLLYNLTKIYVFLPKGLSLETSEECPFSKVTSSDDEFDAFKTLEGTDNKNELKGQMSKYNLFEKTGKSLHDSIIEAINSSQNGYQESLPEYFCSLDVDAHTLLNTADYKMVTPIIIAKYKYLRYLSTSLTYKIPSKKTEAQTTTDNTKESQSSSNPTNPTSPESQTNPPSNPDSKKSEVISNAQ
ncbi:MAG: hypothetical protein GWP09_01360 [Nitrospiraceae bacterium]|nr:hypothetical protein [Nitrospiraceae bacterium]